MVPGLSDMFQLLILLPQTWIQSWLIIPFGDKLILEVSEVCWSRGLRFVLKKKKKV